MTRLPKRKHRAARRSKAKGVQRSPRKNPDSKIAEQAIPVPLTMPNVNDGMVVQKLRTAAPGELAVGKRDGRHRYDWPAGGKAAGTAARSRA